MTKFVQAVLLSLILANNLFADTVVFNNNQLTIPSVSVGDKMYAVNLDLVTNSNPLQFQLLSPIFGEVLSNAVSAAFSNNTLTINQVMVGDNLYDASLQLVSDSPLSFELLQADIICLSCAQSQGVDGSPTLLSASFFNQDKIPVNYSCEGASLSPALTWTPGPEGTVSYAIIMDDPDAVPVAGFTWVHMNLFNIPATTYTIAEGITSNSLPSGASFGLNHNNNNAYDGPCPPPGQGLHNYYWRVYALNETISLPSKPMSRSEFESAYANQILASSYLLHGIFER